MRHGGRTLIYAGCLVAAVAARAAVKSPGEGDTLSSDNPYGAIVERNIFDLHDPPPPPEKPADKGPPPNIKLTGITTIFGHKLALLIVNKPGVAGKPPTTHSLMLKEGQRSDDLEVVEIDPKARTTRIKLDGAESLLNIETNKAVASQPHGGTPGARMPAVAPPGGTPPGFPHNPYGNKTAIPARSMRTDNPPSQNPQYNQAQYNPNQGYGGTGAQTPAGMLNLSGGQSTAANTAGSNFQPTPPQLPLSAQESYTLTEIQRAQQEAAQAQAQQAGTGGLALPPLPPTPLSQQPTQQQESSGASSAPALPVSTLPAALQPRTTGGIIIPGH